MKDVRQEEEGTGLLDRIAAVAGADAALLVAKEFGGRPLYLPVADDLRPDHRLAEVVGLDRARAICNEFRRGEITFPRGPYSSVAETRRRVAELLAARKTHADIAVALNLHIRTVEKIAARLRDTAMDKQQGKLF